MAHQVNALGRNLDGQAIVSLDEASLLREATLNFFGRILTRSDFLIFLEARLRIVDAFKTNPEIDAERTKEPVFVLGLERSGTTIYLRADAAAIAAERDKYRRYQDYFRVPIEV